MDGGVSILLGGLNASRTVFCFVSFGHVACYAPSLKTKTHRKVNYRTYQEKKKELETAARSPSQCVQLLFLICTPDIYAREYYNGIWCANYP